MIRLILIAFLVCASCYASAQTMGVMSGLSGTAAAACSDLKLDHFTATGSPTVYACDAVAVPLFGM